MITAEYVSIAIAYWIRGKLHCENDFAREGLPPIDVETFFKILANDSAFAAAEFSITVSGLGVTATDLQEIARRTGLADIREFADDLHIAAEWRNDRRRHPRTIALAGSYNAGVHTLGHFARPASVDLARALIEYAHVHLPKHHPGSPEVHRQLLSELLRNSELEALLSLESCADFMARWDALIPAEGNRAPLLALPALGLLVDEELFGDDHLGKRLAARRIGVDSWTPWKAIYRSRWQVPPTAHLIS
ncbi:MAG: hypothetical protein ACRERU_12555 [Methylococcales bacterium]